MIEDMGEAMIGIKAAVDSTFSKKGGGWETETVETLCGKPQYGYTDSASASPIGPRFVRITDIQNGTVNWESVPYPDVLRFCRSELLQENCFHAVLEATKSVADKIRTKTGLTGDGAELADVALALGRTGMPFLAFNSLQTESEQSEQKGLLNLMKGMFGTFRNPTAHVPKISWNMTEQDALDLLTMASFCHRRLDAAARTPRTA